MRTYCTKIGYELILEKQIIERSTEIVLKEFNVSKKKIMLNYDIDEKAINRLGYKFLDAKKMDEAILVFSINVDLFPQSKNAKSSLEEAISMTKK